MAVYILKDSARGYTLIELLVVVSIIGMLSSIVLTSLTSARNKGADSAVKQNLISARTEAEIFYDTGKTYEGACSTATAGAIGDNVNAALAAFGVPNSFNDTQQTFWNLGQCHDSISAWAAWVPLKDSASGFPVAFCVDSLGAAKRVTVNLGANAFVCP